MKYKILIGVLAFLFYGCEKEDKPCEIVREGENYVLRDSAKIYVSNYNNTNRIIFKTIAGDEVSFDVVHQETIASYQVAFPCEVDTSKMQTTEGTSQILTYSLINNVAISEPVKVNLFESPEIPTRQAQEMLIVSVGEIFSNSFSVGDAPFYYGLNTNNPHLNFLDSLVIGEKIFYSVYEMNNAMPSDKIEIKYTMNEGVVYMKDMQSLTEYIYERKE